MAKITLRQIYMTYRFDMGKVAEQAEVEKTVVFHLVMEQGSVSRQDAEKVLKVLAKQTGRNYTLETVKIGSKIIEP